MYIHQSIYITSVCQGREHKDSAPQAVTRVSLALAIRWNGRLDGFIMTSRRLAPLLLRLCAGLSRGRCLSCELCRKSDRWAERHMQHDPIRSAAVIPTDRQL